MQSKDKNDSVEFPTRYELYCIAKRYSRGEYRPKILSIGENSKSDHVVPTLTTRYAQSQANGAYLRQVSPQGGSQGMRVYDSNGLATTIASQSGGLGTKTGLYIVASRGRDGKQKLETRKDGNTNSLTSVQKDNYIVDESVNHRIRRLTPIECEFLQSFPKNWTKYGTDNNLISENQRYKCLGNAVTVNIIEAIIRKIQQAK